MKVVVIGNDGRASVLMNRLMSEGHAVKVVPGNKYTEMPLGNIELTDREAIVSYVEEHGADLVVATRIEVSASGIVDALRGKGFLVFGVSQEHSAIENSKAVGKDVARDLGLDLPETMAYGTGERNKAMDFVKSRHKAFTIKPDGVTGGKGVVVCQSGTETLYTLMGDLKWDNGPFVLEETIVGDEFSLEYWVSGGEVKPMVLNLEYKRKADADLGCLTAGMATIQSNQMILNSPFGKEVARKVEEWAQRSGFSGPMYITFLKDRKDSKFKFLEFNVRLCDPEFELMEGLMYGDMAEFMLGMAKNEPISTLDMKMDGDVAVGICAVAGGYPYPNACLQDVPIMVGHNRLHDDIAQSFGLKPMGVYKDSFGSWHTHGGRQFVACGYGGMRKAFADAYNSLGIVSFMDAEYRTDIESLTAQRFSWLQEVGVI